MNINPSIQSCLEIGCALIKQDREMGTTERLPLAIEFFEEVLRQQPNEANACSNLGTIYTNLKDDVKAEEYFKLGVLTHPEYAGCWNNYGNLKTRQQQFETAIGMFRVAEALNPPFIDEVFVSRALVEMQNGNREGAKEFYRKALRVKPGKPEAETFLGMIFMHEGNYAEGAPLFESRLTTAPPWQINHENLKRWDGKVFDPMGKKVLVMAEQGIGDGVQFCRYCKWLKDKGATVYLWVPDHYSQLLHYFFSPWIDQVFRQSEYTMPACDVQIAMGSLPYLRMLCGDGFIMPWIPRLVSAPSGPPTIGLCWRGNPRNPNERYRSMFDHEAAALYSAISRIGKFNIVSIQQGLPLPGETHVPDLSAWPQTIDLINSLTCVIAVDTSICHVAASLGKTTMLMLPKFHHWPWRDDDHCDWYPRMEYFRQTKLGVWDDVIERVAERVGRV